MIPFCPFPLTLTGRVNPRKHADATEEKMRIDGCPEPTSRSLTGGQSLTAPLPLVPARLYRPVNHRQLYGHFRRPHGLYKPVTAPKLGVSEAPSQRCSQANWRSGVQDSGGGVLSPDLISACVCTHSSFFIHLYSLAIVT